MIEPELFAGYRALTVFATGAAIVLAALVLWVLWESIRTDNQR